MRYFLVWCFLFCSDFLAAQYAPVQLKDPESRPVTVDLSRVKAEVFIFLSPECPLCQGYSLTIRELFSKFNKKGIAFTGIVPGADFTVSSVKAYIKDYAIPIRVLRDERKLLVKQLGAVVTPEVFVVQHGKVVYSGRIDNWAYEVGKKRKIVTEHDLEDALRAVTEQKEIRNKKTKAVGCFIE